jgi:proteasome lid subunit RPN8/RPN11
LFIPLGVWEQLQAYVQACPVEINGFGMIDRVGHQFHLREVFILEQTATGASVDVSATAIHQHINQMIQTGQDPSRMRLQWHSHVNMPAYFSGVDLNNIENYGGEWMISLVTNKQGRHELRLDVFNPFRIWTPMELHIVAPPNQRVVRSVQAEINAKVRRPQPRLFRQDTTRPLAALTPVGGIPFDGEEILFWEGGSTGGG